MRPRRAVVGGDEQPAERRDEPQLSERIARHILRVGRLAAAGRLADRKRLRGLEARREERSTTRGGFLEADVRGIAEPGNLSSVTVRVLYDEIDQPFRMGNGQR